MANSKTPNFAYFPYGMSRIPSRTPGVFGLFDQGDPNVTTLLGDTPGPLGLNDYADPNLRRAGVSIPLSPNSPVRDLDGTPLSTGPKANDAARDADLWKSWTPPAGFEVLYEMLVSNEGNLPHMYLDTKNKVTVGIGTYLSTITEAKKLRFYNRETQAVATETEIVADFNAVAAAKPDPKKFPNGKLAKTYKQFTKLDMTPSDIGAQWLADVKKVQGYLVPEFAGFANYPADAKQALTDIAYQYGAHGAAVNYAGGKVKKHAEKGDWKAAAAACATVALYQERNQRRKQLFEAAAKVAPLKSLP